MRMRDKRIELKLSDSEYAEIEKKAELAGLTRTQLIRMLIMGEEIRAKPPEEYLKLVREINAIGNNINQIAKHANETGAVYKSDVEELTAGQREIQKLLRDIFSELAKIQ